MLSAVGGGGGEGVAEEEGPMGGFQELIGGNRHEEGR